MDTYIKSLDAHGVGPFANLHIEFNPHVNIVIGANGVGKTSILRCIAVAPTCYDMQAIRLKENGSVIIETTEKEETHKYGFAWDKTTHYREALSSFRSVPGINPEEKFHLLGSDRQYNLLAIGANRYFSYQRIEGMKREGIGTDRLKQYLRNNISYLDSTAMPDIKQWMINRYFVIEKDWASIEKSNWDKLAELLSNVAPQNIEFKFERIERDLEPIFSINGKECYLEELSSGYKSVLSMLFVIIDWIEGINKDENAKIENAEGTVLIDEIDTHLHPSWQYTILKTLSTIFPKLQFIVTTHSPFVIANAEANELILVPRLSDELDVKPMERGCNNWQIKDILRELMGVQDNRRNGLTEILKNLDEAYEAGDVAAYDSSLSQLSGEVSANDSILDSYEMKRCEIFLRNDKN